MKPYFYVIQHVSSGKYYAGSKYSKDANPSKLLKEDGYKTSSKIVNSIIAREGLASFVVNRIRQFDTKMAAYEYETRFLRKVGAATNERFINLHNNSITLGKENEDGEFLIYASLGGKVQGQRNAESGHMLRIREMVDEEKRVAKVMEMMYEQGTGWLSLSKEEKKMYASLGGKVQGQRNAESGHMLRIREMVDEEKRVAKVKQSLSTNKTGCFLDKDLHRKSASLGGKVQGKRNAESGHLNEILKQYWESVKSGKIERKRKIWCNNGVEEKQIDFDSQIHHPFVKGRLKK